MMIERAHALSPDTNLETVSRRMFGKSYTQLTDEQAGAVWDEIERIESAP
jgi:hypothetical protein